MEILRAVDIQRDGPRKLTGYAAVFDVDSGGLISENGRTFIERIAKGAFAKSIERDDILAYYSHNEDANPPLGRKSSQTLRLHEDGVGVRFWLDLPSWAGHIEEAVQRGDIRGMSIRGHDPVYQWSRRGTTTVGTIVEARLRHIALVATPAYPQTHVVVRSAVHVPDVFDQVQLKRRRLALEEIAG